MTRIRNDLSLVVSWLVSLPAHSLKMQRVDGATNHCGDCSRDGELGNKVVLSYIMIVDCEESKAQAINIFQYRKLGDNLHSRAFDADWIVIDGEPYLEATLVWMARRGPLAFSSGV
jgi:hypothetical protein